MQIHQVHTKDVDRWVLDPGLGPVKQKTQIMTKATTHCITHEGIEYHIQPDGSFEVPDEVGAFYVNRPHDGWYEGPSPYPLSSEELEELYPGMVPADES